MAQCRQANRHNFSGGIAATGRCAANDAEVGYSQLVLSHERCGLKTLQDPFLSEVGTRRGQGQQDHDGHRPSGHKDKAKYDQEAEPPPGIRSSLLP